MKTFVPYFKLSFCIVLFTISLFSIKLNGQTSSLEFTSGAGNPTGNGATVANQVISFRKNANNPSGNTFSTYSPTLKATFSLSNQQYSLASSQISTTKGLSFGADRNDAALAVSYALFPLMNSKGSASNSNFTSTTGITAGSGIDITTNSAVELFTSARALYNAGASTNGRFYFGDLTITFNQPVTNPVLQVVGLGGFYSNLGFTTELEVQTFGITLSKLSGSSELTVSSGKKILNSSNNPGSSTGSGAASGSILAAGSGMTSLTFKIYMRGDGDESTWGASNKHEGDAWLIGVSLTESSMNIILPIKLVSFSAMLNKNNKVDIKWATTSEINVSHFVIEKSFDNKNFNDAGTVFAYGNTNEQMNYSFSDNISSNQSGVLYYRLRSVDVDGEREYSETRIIRIAKMENTITVLTYPNPVSNELRITIPNNWQNKRITYEVFNSNAQVSKKLETGNSSQTESLNVSALTPGFYVVRVTCEGQTAQQKIIKY